MPQGEVIVDPFTGRSLSREALEQMLVPYKRGSALERFDAPLGLYLQAAPPRDVLARMLRNLKEIHRSARIGRACSRSRSASSSCCRSRGANAAIVAWPMPRWASMRRPRTTCRLLRAAPDAVDRESVAARLALLVHGRSPRLH
jgi:hypothetical protein